MMVSKVYDTLVALKMLTGTVRYVVQAFYAMIFFANELRDDLLRGMNKLYIVLQITTDDCHAGMSLSIYSNIYRTTVVHGLYYKEPAALHVER